MVSNEFSSQRAKSEALETLILARTEAHRRNDIESLVKIGMTIFEMGLNHEDEPEENEDKEKIGFVK